MSAVGQDECPSRGQPASPWIQVLARRLRPKVRLICLPYAGGSAVAFHRWGQILDARVELWAIHLPGRGHRMHEAPCTSIERIVGTVADQLAELADLPFALFGHSMGAILSFELARELRRRGGPEPIQLFISGRVGPRTPSPRTPMHSLSDAALIDAMAALNGIPDVVLSDQALMTTVLAAFRADFAALAGWTYCSEQPLDIPIHTYAGRSDPCVSVAGLGAWCLETTCSFGIEMFDGDHFYFRREPAGLVASLEQVLVDRYMLERVAASP